MQEVLILSFLSFAKCLGGPGLGLPGWSDIKNRQIRNATRFVSLKKDILLVLCLLFVMICITVSSFFFGPFILFDFRVCTFIFVGLSLLCAKESFWRAWGVELLGNKH